MSTGTVGTTAAMSSHRSARYATRDVAVLATSVAGSVDMSFQVLPIASNHVPSSSKK
jgi:hypothetical protein